MEAKTLWVPWDPTNPIPFDSAEARSFFGVEPSKGTGNGEHRVLWEICQKLDVEFDPHGPLRQINGNVDSHDVSILGELYEVKEPNKDGIIRISGKDSNLGNSLQSEAESFVSVVEKIDAHVGGEFGWFTSIPKKKSRKKSTAARIKTKYLNREDVNDCVRASDQVRALVESGRLDSMELNVYTSQMSFGDLKTAASGVQLHRWISDPGSALDDFEKMSDCETYFSNEVNKIVLVSRKLGYFVFERGESNRYLSFDNLDMGLVKLKIKREALSVARLEAETVEALPEASGALQQVRDDREGEPEGPVRS